ncbi:MAG TPA: hypothetical protein VGM39_10035, partial [Kofleriaceae bacterium]
MKPGRVIGGDEHEAKVAADRIIEDATKLATEIVGAARREADRATTKAEHALAYDATTSNPIVDTPAGTVDEVVGLVVRATLPGVALGEVVKIDRRGRGELLPAEVVGFRGEQAVLLPLGELNGIAPASSVWRTGGP